MTSDDALTRRLLVAGLRTWADQLEAGGDLATVLAGIAPAGASTTAGGPRPPAARTKRKAKRAAPQPEGAAWPDGGEPEGTKLARELLATDRWEAQGFHAAVLQRWANGGHCSDASVTRMRQALSA